MAFESNITDVTIWNPDGSKGSVPHPIGCKGNNLEVLFDWDNRFLRPGYGEYSPFTQSLQQFFIQHPGNYIANECETAGSEQYKRVVIDQSYHFELNPGAIIAVPFQDTNSADNPKLNVNATGAKPVRKGNMIPPNVSGDAGMLAGYISFFQYDGTNWNWISYGAMPQIQANWNESDNTQPSFIQNKPTLGDISSLNKNNNTAQYLRGDGAWSTPPDNNTTYTFANGTNGFTVTPSGGNAQFVTVTPSITNNITGSGTSGYIAKFNGGNSITNGPAFGNDTTKFLNNKGEWAVPSYPTVNNATLTIQKNGTTVQTFTANASSNVTCNITVPTNTNQLTNGAGFITSSGSCNYANSAGGVAWSNVSSRPTKLSQFTNDSGFITSSGSCNYATTAGSAGYATSAGSAVDQTARNTANAALPKSGGTMTGNLYLSGTHGLCLDAQNIYISKNSAGWIRLNNGQGGIEHYAQYHDFKTATGAWNNVSGLQFINQSNSSRKIKENIQDITEDEAEKLLDVRVVSFDYKTEAGFGNDDERKGKFGVIAEEVNDVIPFVVNYAINDNHEVDKNEPSGVNYEKFVPHLIKMVQMQENKINELEIKISELKNK